MNTIYPDEYPGFSHFSGFLHCFVLVKLATSSIRVKVVMPVTHSE